MKLRVAGAQIPVTTNIEENVSRIAEAIDQAAGGGAQILLTPEGSVSGYTHEFDAEQVRQEVTNLVARASVQGMGLALGTCYQEPDGLVYNQLRLYAQDGAYLGFHAKILRTGTFDSPPQGEIQAYSPSPLRAFSFAGITVSALICNDLWANPECTPMPDMHLSQILAERGVRVLFHGVNGGRDAGDYSQVVVKNFHESQLRMRARAGKLWIVSVDSSHPEEIPCSSRGGVVRPDGSWAVQIPDKGTQVFVHEIDLGDNG
jgi:predicted amidohydrolase